MSSILNIHKKHSGSQVQDLGQEISAKLQELRHGYDILCSTGALGDVDFAAFASSHIYRIIRDKMKHDQPIPIDFVEGVLREALSHMPMDNTIVYPDKDTERGKSRAKEEQRSRTDKWTRFMAHYVANSANNSCAFS